MNVKIINEEKYLWHYEKVGDVKIFIKGMFCNGGKCLSYHEACKELANVFTADIISPSNFLPTEIIIKEKISELSGNFSFIINEPDFVLAAVDKIRSYPIFYSNKGGIIYISNSAVKLQEEADLYEKDKISFLEFEMAGYVTGSTTLFKDLLQLRAGEFLLFDKKIRNLDLIRYYRYWTDEVIEESEDDLIEELHSATVKTFSDMVKTLDGRPVWIPLSGGLDSRLVLAMLCELKYDNISTFSYGIPGLWEIKQAKRVAEHLNVKWYYIPYKPKNIRKLFYTKEREDYFYFASGLSSVPFLSDFYALWILRNDGTISDDSVVINGQTGDYLTGGHIPEMIMKIEENDVDVSILLKAIIDKHFSLWINLKTEKSLSIIYEKILSSLQLTPGSKLSISEFARYFELHEWQERQSKHVVNGQRMYEWFGYDWRLPLWSDELMSFWIKVDWKQKYGQRLYKQYLKRYDPCGVFSLKSKAQYYPYEPPFVKVLNRIFTVASKFTKKEPISYVQKYTKYFMTYAPFYPQRSYFEFLKDSQWHRNPVSYFAKNLLVDL